MTNETLAQLLNDLVALPDGYRDVIVPGMFHHQLDYASPLRRRGYSSVGQVFGTQLDSHAVSGCYFWLDRESGAWDLHFYTFEGFRRNGFATALFREGVLPWLRKDGYDGQRICTTALGPESVGLLKQLGFVQDRTNYVFTITCAQ